MPRKPKLPPPMRIEGLSEPGKLRAEDIMFEDDLAPGEMHSMAPEVIERKVNAREAMIDKAKRDRAHREKFIHDTLEMNARGAKLAKDLIERMIDPPPHKPFRRRF
jgi:hypothetical protein